MLGDRLRWLRNHAKLSQADVAEQVGRSEIQVLRWENGKAEPDADSIRKLAHVFGVTSDYLLGLSDTPRGYMDTDLSASEWAIIRVVRESNFADFMALVTEALKAKG